MCQDCFDFKELSFLADKRFTIRNIIMAGEPDLFWFILRKKMEQDLFIMKRFLLICFSYVLAACPVFANHQNCPSRFVLDIKDIFTVIFSYEIQELDLSILIVDGIMYTCNYGDLVTFRVF